MLLLTFFKIAQNTFIEYFLAGGRVLALVIDLPWSSWENSNTLKRPEGCGVQWFVWWSIPLYIFVKAYYHIYCSLFLLCISWLCTDFSFQCRLGMSFLGLVSWLPVLVIPMSKLYKTIVSDWMGSLWYNGHICLLTFCVGIGKYLFYIQGLLLNCWLCIVFNSILRLMSLVCNVGWLYMVW